MTRWLVIVVLLVRVVAGMLPAIVAALLAAGLIDPDAAQALLDALSGSSSNSPELLPLEQLTPTPARF